MKINGSAVSMAASRTYQQTTSYQVSTTLKANSSNGNSSGRTAASLTLSGNGVSALRSFRQKLRSLDSDTTKKTESDSASLIPQSDDTKLKMLKRMLEILKKSMPGYKEHCKIKERGSSLLSPAAFKGSKTVDLTTAGVGNTAATTGWTRTTTTSAFFSEAESVTFSATGSAVTADGRAINFQVDLSMSRRFIAESAEITEATEQILCDPLVINLDSSTASVSDQKFYFDLNADGEKETVSFVGEGSGFLALDRNGDGEINDGSELFGTRSGDGFAELSEYDADSNGWIDENDEVFSKLRVWTKDSEGNNVLMDLKSADVGAIYLGRASTEFSLNDRLTNEQNAVIRSTGIFLKESGQVSTIQHVDLAL